MVDNTSTERYYAKAFRLAMIVTIPKKRSIFNENTLQIASSIDDRYFMNDYHELPGFVYPVMEKLCQSVADHKGNLLRKFWIEL